MSKVGNSVTVDNSPKPSLKSEDAVGSKSSSAVPTATPKEISKAPVPTAADSEALRALLGSPAGSLGSSSGASQTPATKVDHFQRSDGRRVVDEVVTKSGAKSGSVSATLIFENGSWSVEYESGTTLSPKDQQWLTANLISKAITAQHQGRLDTSLPVYIDKTWGDE